MIEIGLIAFSDFEELDLIGPWEAFGVAREQNPDRFDLHLIAADRDPIRARKGLTILPEKTFREIETLDVLLTPGGHGSRAALRDRALLDFVKRIAPSCAWVTSVCTGSLVLAAAGALRGKRATTHQSALGALSNFDVGEVVNDARYVRDGRTLTAGGVSAGTDMALWLIGELAGVEAAKRVMTEMEYWPEPPYGGVGAPGARREAGREAERPSPLP